MCNECRQTHLVAAADTSRATFGVRAPRAAARVRAFHGFSLVSRWKLNCHPALDLCFLRPSSPVSKAAQRISTPSPCLLSHLCLTNAPLLSLIPLQSIPPTSPPFSPEPPPPDHPTSLNHSLQILHIFSPLSFRCSLFCPLQICFSLFPFWCFLLLLSLVLFSLSVCT